jgi:small-conductance mechanosensitive channel
MRLILSILVCLIAFPAVAAELNWTGTWDTRWRDGGARMELKQEGSKVTGTYPSADGVIEGQVDGRVLKGHWKQGQRSGGIVFVLASYGGSFVGRYASGEWWTGGRLSDETDQARRPDQRGPREVMRSLLDAGNAARYDAPDQMSRVVTVVDFGESGPSMPAEQKLGQAQTLFDLIDQTTFQLPLIPDRTTTDDTLSLTLAQAGTNATLPLRFVRKNDHWFVVMPDQPTLDIARKALLARSGGRFPSPEAYKLRHNARDAMRSFIRSFYEWNQGGQAQALASIDLSQLPEAVRKYQGNLAAQYLNGVLNRVGFVEPQEISDDPTSTEPFVVFSHPAGRAVIAPHGTGDGASWQFTAETAATARDLYVAVEDMPIVKRGTLPAPPSRFFTVRQTIRDLAPPLLMQIGTLELWQIAGWALVLLLSAAIGFGLMKIILFATSRVVPDGLRRNAGMSAFHWSLWGTASCIVYKMLMPAIGLPDLAGQLSIGISGVLLAASVMWLGWLLLDWIVAAFFSDATQNMAVDNILVSLGVGALKLALIAVGLTFIAMELSLPYEGMIASLSIGGLAVAFASRETLSNVFGAGILAIDRPFRRGDWITTGDTKGTVEHVGIRSTRIRTADDSLIIVPNGKLSDATVNNLGTRRFHLNTASVPLPYTTPAAQVGAMMAGIKKLIAAIPEAAPDRTFVSIATLTNDIIEIQVKYGLNVRSTTNETEIINRLMMNILQLREDIAMERSRSVGKESAAAA